MKVLLTGATGFLGKSILGEKLKNLTLFTLSRTSGDYMISLERDIPKFKQSFDMVIHAAGKAHTVPKTELEKKQFYSINVIGTENLLKGLEEVMVPKRFVFISSVAVYGLEKGNDINEKYPLLAKDPYGLSKIEAEELVRKWCDDNQVICTIFRLPLLVGKKPPGNLGAMVKAINKGYYFNVGGGTARKSMVLANDVANFILKVAPLGGTYNLTDGIHPSFGELSLAISKNKKEQFNLPLSVAEIAGKIGDFVGGRFPFNTSKIKKMTSDLTFDDLKARSLLSWQPESVLDYVEKENLY